MKPIRFGIWGTGTVAQAFARGLTHAPGAELAGVVSRDPARGQAFATALGASRVFANPEQLLADGSVDVVYVATPNHLHKEHTLAALAARKAVLCEKPFALNATEARAMVEAARRARTFCMEAMWMRFMPLVRRARRLALDGALGRVLGLTADFGLPVAEDHALSAWRPEAGGGALLDRGIYCLSLASWLFGRPERTTAIASFAPTGVDATSIYTLAFRTGATATLWASLRAQGTNEAVILGSHANLRIHEPFMRPHRLSLGQVRSPAAPAASEPAAPGLVRRLKESAHVQHVLRRAQVVLGGAGSESFEPIAGTGYQFEAIEVMRCLREGLLESPDMPLDESVAILELADELRRGFATPAPAGAHAQQGP